MRSTGSSIPRGITSRSDKIRRGMVLYIVAVVIVLLTLAALSLSSLMHTEYEATLLHGDDVQIALVARSGIDYVATAIAPPIREEIPETPPGTLAAFGTPDSVGTASAHHSSEGTASLSGSTWTMGNLINDPARFAAITVASVRPRRLRQGAACFTVLSPRLEEERLAGVRYGLQNESARLHLGMVIAWEQMEPGSGGRALMKLPGMTPSIADSILDWIDADKTPRPSGAEIDYYERLGLPYAPRNAVPVALEELLLIRDVTRPLLFGNDETQTFGYSKSGERHAIGAELPWSLLLTTYSAEKLFDQATGRVKIWLNESDGEFLHAQLAKRLDRESADFVLRYRQQRSNIGAVATAPSGQEGMPTEIDMTQPMNRTIESPLDLLDVTVAGRKSPFSLDGADGEGRFLKLLDAATEREDFVVYGRVNINEAPRCVLEAIPGITPEAATRILARRLSFNTSATSEQAFASSPDRAMLPVTGVSGTTLFDENDAGRGGRLRHPCWLLAEKIVDIDTMRRLWPSVTCGGDVWRAQIVAFYEGEGPSCRLEVVLDATIQPPRRIFLKELTLHGIGYPREILRGAPVRDAAETGVLPIPSPHPSE